MSTVEALAAVHPKLRSHVRGPRLELRVRAGALAVPPLGNHPFWRASLASSCAFLNCFATSMSRPISLLTIRRVQIL